MTTEIASTERQGMADLILAVFREVEDINSRLKAIEGLPFSAELSLIGLGEDGQYIHSGPDRSCPEITLAISSDTSPTPKEELVALLENIECINLSIDNIRRYIGGYIGANSEGYSPASTRFSLNKLGRIGYGIADLSKGPIGLYRLTVVVNPGYCS